MAGTLLLIGDDAVLRRRIQEACDALETGLVQVAGAEQALEFLSSGSADLVLGGVEALERLRAGRPGLPTVLVAPAADSRQTIEAVKRGALDCLIGSLRQEDLVQRLREALRVAREADSPAPAQRQAPRPTGVRLVGQSPAMQEVYKLIGLIAPRDINVLVTGESGTGKELVARAVWEHSPRFEKAFVAVNCAAIPETLLESELFGHEKGTFTGADARRIGKFEVADGGILFVDEVGDIPLATQAKLLRVLQDRTFQRLGSNAEIRCDVRIIAATHQDLEQLVEGRQFRQDLYYRIKVATIHVPPLREREVDAVLLAHYFLGRFNRQMGTQVRGFEPEAVAALLAYPWPGNVRQLENVIKASLVIARGPTFHKEFLPEHVRTAAARLPAATPAGRPAHDAPAIEPLARALVESPSLRGRVFDHGAVLLERAMIHAGLEHTGGQLARAAALLGISRTTLRKKMREHGIVVRTMPVQPAEGLDAKH